MYTVYVLKSVSADWFYVGMTSDFDRRLSDHNSGYNLSTKVKTHLLTSSSSRSQACLTGVSQVDLSTGVSQVDSNPVGITIAGGSLLLPFFILNTLLCLLSTF